MRLICSTRCFRFHRQMIVGGNDRVDLWYDSWSTAARALVRLNYADT